ncbi:MAG: TonB-dependent receptor [Pseudomonadota bacterium]
MDGTHPHHLAVAALSVLLLGSLPITAGAQESMPATVDTIAVETLPTPPEAVGAETAVQQLDAVVVSAQKREQNAQDVPMAVSAFNQKSLDNLNITNQISLQQAVPGLDVNSLAQFTTIYLRGVGSDVFLNGDPSVATYVDGIYFPFAQSLDQDFGAVERLEVLKGPQGTLFGRNTTGGAISVTTKAPSFKDYESSLQLVYGNRDTRNIRLHQNIPLTPWLALSFSGYDNRADPYYKGTANGEPLRQEFSRGGRGKLRIAPLDNLDITLVAAKQIQRGQGSVFQLNTDPSPLFQCVGGVQTPTCIQPQTGYEGDLSEPTFLRFNSNVGYGSIKYSAPWLDVKLLGGHQRANSTFSYDFDGSPQSIAAFDQKSNFARVENLELQFVSNDTTPLSERLQWIAGLNYFKSKQGFDPAALQLAGLDLTDTRPGGLSLPAPLLTVLDQLNLAIPNDLGLAFHAILGTDSRAGFVQARFALTDYLSLTAGGRYQSEDRFIVRSDSGALNSDGSFTTLFDWKEIGPQDADGNTVPSSSNTKSFSPKGVIELRPFGADTLIYASYQEAQKSATYNTVALYLPPAFVKPEKIKGSEVGLKTTLFDGALQFNLAAFRYDIRDLQVQFISLFQGGAVSFENAGAASVRGLDAESRIKIFPQIFDRLLLTLGASLLDGQYDDYTSASGFDPQTGFFGSDNDYTGNRTVRTPKFTGTVGLSKSWKVPGGRLEIGGDLYRNTGFDYAASNDPRFGQPGYTLYGARIGYRYQPWGLSLTGYGRNLGNRQYTQGLIATDFGPNYSLAPPITYGLRLNLDL